MNSLIECLKKIPDRRRRESKQYQLWEIVFCAIASILSNGESYRDIHRFVTINFTLLKEQLGLTWKQLPHFTTYRNILLTVKEKDLEDVFREFSQLLLQNTQLKHLAVDGKTLRGSYNEELARKPIHLLQVFEPIKKIIVAHEEVGKKTNEIPVWQMLAQKLKLEGIVVTLDALHCQKNSKNTA